MLLKYSSILLRGAGFTRCKLLDRTISNFNVEPRFSSVLQPHRFYSSNKNAAAIGIADYSAVKQMPNEPQKFLIDVREPDELKQTGQIPSSINIPLGIVSQELAASDQDFKSKYGRDKPNFNTEIIFHCKIGKRSLAAAEAAVSLGFTNVKNYKGSWLDWAEREGLPK